jgi:8-oxo-dGTP diphosphatase
MLDKGVILRHYKRPEIQNAIIELAAHREIGIRYEITFGKRPDIIKFPKDVLEFVKRGATSFHCSEERWENPIYLSTGLKPQQLNDMRIGWDLVIDIDFEVWEITKHIANEIIKALKEHGVSSISCKFSGNKGFHIGVPFEAFPKKVHGQETKLLFPEATKRVVTYLADYIDSKEKGFALSKKIIKSNEFNDFLKKTGKSINEFTKDICLKCGAELKSKDKKQVEFICPKCGKTISADESVKYMICDKDKIYMERIQNTAMKKCSKCGGTKFGKKVNLFIDTLLVSSRHLYRMSYSFHEKSGLVSIPIDPNKVLEFDKSAAKPEIVRIPKFKFLDTKNVKEGEAGKLIIEAFDYNPQIEEEENDLEKKEYEPLGFALQEEFFPPCIKKGLKGLKDGRKRFSFLLINFLNSVSWDYEKIEQLIVKWNKKNDEPLRESNLLAQVKYHKRNKKKILPPNCDNSAYYKDIGICEPDNLCNRIKNPINYSRIKVRSIKKSRKKGIMKRIQIAGAIIEKEGKIIMHIRSYNPGKEKLDFIGGFVDKNETIEHAAIRETREETGLDVRLIKKLGSFDYFEREEKTIHMFIAEIIKGKIINSNEGEVVWVDIENLLPKRDMSFPQHKQMIDAYKKYKESF